MQVGDLVKLKRSIGPTDLYGVGLIVAIKNSRCIISWSESGTGRLGSCASYALELVSESR